MKDEKYFRDKYHYLFDAVDSCCEFYHEDNFYLAINEVKFSDGELWGYYVIEFIVDEETFTDELSLSASYGCYLPIDDMSKSRITQHNFTQGLIEYLRRFDDE